MGLRTLLGLKAKPARPLIADDHRWFAGKQFTRDWTTNKFDLWLPAILHLQDKVCSVLEIGTYEGRTSIAFLELLPLSHITCIDTFRDDREQRFDHNLSSYGSRVRKIKGRAAGALDTLAASREQFDLIYLDAVKDKEGVFVLSALAWFLLKPDGVIIWDDMKYQLKDNENECLGRGIQSFCDAFSTCMTLLHDDRQRIARKISSWPE
jgi:predicted O-methyltransferase YrrM